MISLINIFLGNLFGRLMHYLRRPQSSKRGTYTLKSFQVNLKFSGALSRLINIVGVLSEAYLCFHRLIL